MPVTPIATVTVDDNENIPFAERIFDTKKLYRRWAICCEITLNIAHIGFKHADNIQTQATIVGTIGLLFGSKDMQQAAAETNKHAHETRKATVYVAFVFLLASIAATSLWWAFEEGVVGLITKSITACAKYCYNAICDAGNWIKSKAMGMFKHNNTEENLTSPINLSNEHQNEEVFDAVVVELEQSKTQPTMLFSDLHTPHLPSAPTLDKFDTDSKTAALIRESSQPNNRQFQPT